MAELLATHQPIEDNSPELSLVVADGDPRVLVPRDTAEVFMFRFVTLQFIDDNNLKAKTKQLLNDVIRLDAKPETVQFTEEEGDLLMEGLWRVFTTMPIKDWRWKQAGLMLGFDVKNLP